MSDDFESKLFWRQRLMGRLEPYVHAIFGCLSFVVVIAMVLVLGYPHHNVEDTVRTLEDQGYSEVEIREEGGWWECGKGDFYKTPFQATNPKGKRVNGIVCCGLLFKSCTLRF